MKAILIAIGLAFITGIASAQSFGLSVTVDLDPSIMGGLTTNDYCTNFTVIVGQANNASVAPSNYTLAYVLPGPQFTLTSTGAVMNIRIPIDRVAHFYVVSATNTVGNPTPFSPVAVWLPAPLGKVSATK